jgi:hypothetical protein
MRRLQELVMRTAAGPLRPLWLAGYGALARAIAAFLRRADASATIYLGGSFGHGEPVVGLSDLDVIAVSARDPGAIRRRWRALVRRVPLLARVAADVFVYSEEELRRAAGAPCMTSTETFHRRDDVHDEAGLTVRPGPFGATREWRLLCGPERRAEATADAQSRRLAAWLELQFWWRFAFRAAADPAAPETPFLCVKLIAEPARLWLWLARGRAVFARGEVLREAIAAIPGEREAFELANELRRGLTRCPDPPLAAALASFTRQSAMLAALMNDAADAADGRAVRLAGIGSGPPPLMDWRALVAPSRTHEQFRLVDGDPGDPEALSRLGVATTGPSPALHAAPLLVRPAVEPARAKLRAVQCAATDPVSFALVAGRDAARFAELPGWSAADWARRAVAEHRVWLQGPGPARLNGHAWLGAAPARERLITAARAALFHESLERDDPELVLPARLVAERLEAELDDVTALERAVGSLPAYR